MSYLESTRLPSFVWCRKSTTVFERREAKVAKKKQCHRFVFYSDQRSSAIYFKYAVGVIIDTFHACVTMCKLRWFFPFLILFLRRAEMTPSTKVTLPNQVVDTKVPNRVNTVTLGPVSLKPMTGSPFMAPSSGPSGLIVTTPSTSQPNLGFVPLQSGNANEHRHLWFVDWFSFLAAIWSV